MMQENRSTTPPCKLFGRRYNPQTSKRERLRKISSSIDHNHYHRHHHPLYTASKYIRRGSTHTTPPIRTPYLFFLSTPDCPHPDTYPRTMNAKICLSTAWMGWVDPSDKTPPLVTSSIYCKAISHHRQWGTLRGLGNCTFGLGGVLLPYRVSNLIQIISSYSTVRCPHEHSFHKK